MCLNAAHKEYDNKILYWLKSISLFFQLPEFSFHNYDMTFFSQISIWIVVLLLWSISSLLFLTNCYHICMSYVNDFFIAFFLFTRLLIFVISIEISYKILLMSMFPVKCSGKAFENIIIILSPLNIKRNPFLKTHIRENWNRLIFCMIVFTTVIKVIGTYQ